MKGSEEMGQPCLRHVYGKASSASDKQTDRSVNGSKCWGNEVVICLNEPDYPDSTGTKGQSHPPDTQVLKDIATI